jgi:monothiol glutaredoxin
MNSETKQRIEETIKSERVVIFMKGTEHMPMCGFSASAVRTLKAAGVAKMLTVNVLRDPEVREGIKEFSNWPTIPQVYIDGKFIGGADIIRDLMENGELETMVKGA